MLKFYQEWQSLSIKLILLGFCIYGFRNWLRLLLHPSAFFFSIGFPWELLGPLGARKHSLCSVDQFLSSGTIDILGEIVICWGGGGLSHAL